MSDMKKTGFLLKRINSFIIFTFPSITNVVRRCALQLLMSKQKTLTGQADAEGSLTERNTENVKLLRGLRRTALLVLPAALPGMNL